MLGYDRARHGPPRERVSLNSNDCAPRLGHCERDVAAQHVYLQCSAASGLPGCLTLACRSGRNAATRCLGGHQSGKALHEAAQDTLQTKTGAVHHVAE